MPRASCRPFITVILALALLPITAFAYEPIQPHLGAGQGTWPDQVVFDLVPAPRDVVPELSVVHDHRVPDGVLGQGFTLNGLSVITRHSATGGVPGVTQADLYRLDGQLLLKVPGTSRWEPEVQTGTTLSYNSNNSWTMKKEGWTWIYGNRTSKGTGATKYIRDPGRPGGSTSFPAGGCSNLKGLCNTAAWYLSLVTDPYGNTISYGYTVKSMPTSSSNLPPYPYPQQHLLSRIGYADGHATVELTYQQRPMIHSASDHGTPSLLTHRLDEVKVFGHQRAFYSRYSFEYQDESTTDCNGQPAATSTGLDQPRKVLLRRIHRHDNTGQGRVMRCYETAHEAPSWTPAQNVTSSITAPNVSGSVAGTFVAPIPMNADGDGLTDLALLGFNCGPYDIVTGNLMPPEYELDGGIPAGDLGVKPYRCEADHQVFVSTPQGPKPFARSGTGHPSQAHLAAWEGLLNRTLNGSTLQHNQGYALIDLDRDAWPELLWEDSGVKISDYRPGNQNFTDSSLPISAAELRKGSFVDVNGDGFPDLALREEGLWIPNQGVAPWLVSNDALPLNMPVTTNQIPAELRALITDPAICDNFTQTGSHPNFYGTDPVPDPNTWSTGHYRTGQTRLTDINGDGLVDAAIAFYACWDDGAPVAESAYSRIFWGDGHGSFVDSGLPAGPPFMFPRNTPGKHLDGFTMLDVDGDQRAEMLQLSAHGLSTSNYSAIGGGYDHGMTDGFVLPDPGHPYGTPQGFTVPLDSLSRVNHSTALADFDGDSFPDLLVLEMEGDEDDDFDPAGGWVVELRHNRRSDVEGRVLTMHGEHGGRTDLEWGWSALAPHDNPELPQNLEVLEEVDGADGVVRAVYSRGHHAPHRGFTGFGLVQVTNPRGGVVEHAFATTPALQGKPTHGVRYRHDGTIERATVYVHGHPGATIGPLYVDLTPPFFNPMLRQCDFDLDFGRRTGAGPRQTFSVDTLVEDCTEYGVPKDEGPPLAEMMVVIGHHQHPDHEGLASIAHAMWSPAGDDQPFELGQLPELVPGIKASPGQSTAQAPPPTENRFRWPVPAGVAVPNALELGSGDLTFPAGGVPTHRRFYVTDWQYEQRDDGRYVLDKELRHRDVTTPGDDQRTIYTWSAFNPTYWGRRLEQRRQINAAGAQFERFRVTRWSSDFDLPAAVETCGTDLNRCRTDRYTWTGRGEMKSHTYPDQSSDAWTYAWCGAPEKYTDPVSRDRVTTYDGRCLRRTEAWEGAVTTTTYDGFNRLVRQHEQPGGTADAQLLEVFFDDKLDHIVDTSFVEPRVATRRGDGQVILTYHDEFGRTTREEICQQSNRRQHAGDGVLDKVWCQPNTTQIAGWGLFGPDGLVRATIDPHFENELPVVRAVTRDGFGRVVAEQMPAHVPRRAGRQAWSLTTTVHGPDYRERTDPLGRLTRVDSTTLGFEVAVAGKFRGRTQLDAFSRTVRRVASDGLAAIIDYDELHHPKSLQLDATAPCLRPNGSLNPACIWRRSYTHDLQGRLETATGADGQTYTYQLDAIGRPLKIQHGGKVIRSWSYVPASASALARTEETDEAGNVTVRHIDGLGRVQQIDDLSGTTTLKWGADGQLQERVDPNQRVTTWDYDVYDHLAETVRPQSGRTRITYDGAGRKLSVTDADGATLESTYTFSGLLEKETLGPWETFRGTYDAGGRPLDFTNDGITTRFTHDDWSRLTRRDDGWNPATRSGLSHRTFTYDDDDRVLTDTLAPVAGSRLDLIYKYNALGWLESSRDGAGREVKLFYDRAGRPRARDDEEGHRRINEYNARGGLSRLDIDGRGALRRSYQAPTSFGGQTALHRFTTTDDDGHTLTHYLDGLNRTAARVYPDGTYNTYTYTGRDLTGSDLRDADGNVLLTLSYEHDPASGQLVGVEGPSTPTELASGDIYRLDFAYTAAGRPRTLTTADDFTRFTYDAHGLPATEASNHLGPQSGQNLTKFLVRGGAPGSAPWVTRTRLVGTGGTERTWDYERDALGRLTATTVTDSSGKLRREWLGLNALGQPETSRVLLGGQEEVRREWQYNARGQPTNRATFLKGQLYGATQWTWYKNGALKSIRTPNGRWMHYDYGTPFDHQLDRVHDGLGNDIAKFKRRNGRGQPELIDLMAGNTTLELTYDAFGRLEDRLSTSPQNGRHQLHLAYDKAGRLRAEELKDGSQNWLNQYTYDGPGRLVNEVRGATGDTYRYVLDGAGNRLETWHNSGSGERRTLNATYQGPRLATVNGTQLTYDAWHAVTVDQRGYRYGRGPDGRVRTIAGGQGPTTTVFRDSYGVPAAYQEGSRGTRKVTWRLDPDAPPLEVKEATGDVITYIRAEGLLLARLTNGTAQVGVALEDSAGSLTRLGSTPLRSATAFGEGVQAPPGVDERYLYAGLEHLPTAPGIHMAHHRVYDPQTGRFLSPDPIGLRGGAHRYLYADGNPVMKRDPQGLAAITPQAGGSALGTYLPPGDNGGENKSLEKALDSILSGERGESPFPGPITGCQVDCPQPMGNGTAGSPFGALQGQLHNEARGDRQAAKEQRQAKREERRAEREKRRDERWGERIDPHQPLIGPGEDSKEYGDCGFSCRLFGGKHKEEHWTRVVDADKAYQKEAAKDGEELDDDFTQALWNSLEEARSYRENHRRKPRMKKQEPVQEESELDLSDLPTMDEGQNDDSPKPMPSIEPVEAEAPPVEANQPQTTPPPTRTKIKKETVKQPKKIERITLEPTPMPPVTLDDLPLDQLALLDSLQEEIDEQARITEHYLVNAADMGSRKYSEYKPEYSDGMIIVKTLTKAANRMEQNGTVGMTAQARRNELMNMREVEGWATAALAKLKALEQLYESLKEMLIHNEQARRDEERKHYRRPTYIIETEE